MWTESSGPQQGAVTGSCEHGSELSESIKKGEFLEQFSDYQIIKKGCTPLS
jgi:hypothetical protein